MIPGSPVVPSYRRPRGVHPPLDCSGYRPAGLRHPDKRPALLPRRLAGTVFGTVLFDV
jgi:hypothetical protein